jgi:hypothetical protein
VTGINKAAASASMESTKTVTDFVTSYVTAVASVVVVPGPAGVASAVVAASSGVASGVTASGVTASGVSGLPSVVAVPDQAGNAGLIGRGSRVFRS